MISAFQSGLGDFAAWAWARHHNEWSWYIRPLFLLPYCWFAWRRSLLGILLTLLALATSMFWFPEPDEPSPAVLAALAAEREYLLGDWTWWKLLLAGMVPALLFALALAFWQRSAGWGVAIVNLMAVTKILWTFVFMPPDAAMRHLAPALIGLVACNLVLFTAILWLRRRGLAGSA